MRQQTGPSWFTPAGVHAKLKQLEAKGLPDFGGWRFITLTCDQQAFNLCPLTAFLVGRDHMRRFLDRCREKGLWLKESKWAWKLEFQCNGWPHWHLLVDRKAKFSRAEMRLVEDLWGLGGTNCRRISKSGKFGYLFKYAFKGVYQEDGDGTLSVPGWFLDFYKPAEGDKRPESFSRVRFWQTSKGFYTGIPPKKSDSEGFSSIVPRPVRTVIEDRDASLVVCSRDAAGTYKQSCLVRLAVPFNEFLRFHLWDVENGCALVLASRSLVVAPDTLNRFINQTDQWKAKQTLQENRFTLMRADVLRREHRTLETC